MGYDLNLHLENLATLTDAWMQYTSHPHFDRNEHLLGHEIIEINANCFQLMGLMAVRLDLNQPVWHLLTRDLDYVEDSLGRVTVSGDSEKARQMLIDAVHFKIFPSLDECSENDSYEI